MRRVGALLGVLVCLLLMSCDNLVNYSPNNHDGQDEELISKILYEGDTTAYQQLYDYWEDNGAAEHCLAYALVMANKFHYAPAAYHVYEILTGLYSSVPITSDDPDVADFKAALADIDSAIAVVAALDPSLDSAISNYDRGLDCLDPETRKLALSYYGRSLF